MLAAKKTAGVAPEVNLRECTSHTPLPSVNKAEPTVALKPRGDVTRSPKQGYQWPHKKDLSMFLPHCTFTIHSQVNSEVRIERGGTVPPGQFICLISLRHKNATSFGCPSPNLRD